MLYQPIFKMFIMLEGGGQGGLHNFTGFIFTMGAYGCKRRTSPDIHMKVRAFFGHIPNFPGYAISRANDFCY
jgi:hypothetical protein